MSIKIHHGPPGSYKTSGAVVDDFVPAVLAGRHVITNVRGLSDPDKVREVLEGKGKQVPATFQLTYLDSNERENMDMLRRYFHWAPDGAFFLIDEVQEVWPKSMKDKELRLLEYPNGIDAANDAGKFHTLALSFEKHRHRNWDFVVTSPNIAKVHPVVRESAEAAYKHKNLATLGKLFSGRYIEAYHAADTNGRTSDFYTVRKKRIPRYAFDLYASTATGQYTDTTAGQSLFKDPKILLLLSIIAGLAIFVFSMDTPDIIAGVDVEETTPASNDVDSQNIDNNRQDISKSDSLHSNTLGNVRFDTLPPRLGFLEDAQTLYLTSYAEIGTQTLWKVSAAFSDGASMTLSQETAPALGLGFKLLSQCYAELSYQSHRFYAYCAPEEEEPDIFTAPANFAFFPNVAQ